MTDTTSRPGAPAEHLSIEEAAALAPVVSAAEAAERVAGGAFLVDVRSEAGRSRTGSIPGATVGDHGPQSAYGLGVADRYRARMQPPIVASDPAAISSASSGGTPMASNTDARCSDGMAFWLSMNASPSPGVCQILAKSCHS